MTPPTLIFLIGMPCAGKTSWGQIWAAENGWHFIDLDTVVEQQAGCAIAEMFASESEVAFREKERMALREIIQTASPNTIVACGGGTPVFHDNTERMKSAGMVIYLKTKIDVLISRAAQSHIIRPLLFGTDLHIRMEELLAARADYYEQADVILNSEDLSVNTFTKILKSCTNPH